MIYQKGDLMLIKSRDRNQLAYPVLNLWTDVYGVHEAIVLNLPATIILLESIDTSQLVSSPRSVYVKVLTLAGPGSIGCGWLEDKMITLLCPANNEQ